MGEKQKKIDEKAVKDAKKQYDAEQKAIKKKVEFDKKKAGKDARRR